jgi:hypothetical protein
MFTKLLVPLDGTIEAATRADRMCLRLVLKLYVVVNDSVYWVNGPHQQHW